MTTLFLCGDVMTGRGIDQILAHPSDPQLHEPYIKDARQYVELAERVNGHIDVPVADHYVWGFALETLEQAKPAARIINLETTVTASDKFWKGKGIHYRMSPDNLGCLIAAKIDCCSLANNHVLDWGYPGLDETLLRLRQAGLKNTGAGLNQRSAKAPVVLTAESGRRIVVFALGTSDCGIPPQWAATQERPGVAFLPDFSQPSVDDIVHEIVAARHDEHDLVVVSIHWGGNWGYGIQDEHREFAHRLIDDAGADVIHGHSSHHVKGIEVYRDRLILYGCGDLITDYEGISGREVFRGDLSMLYLADIDAETGRLRGLRMQPTQMRKLQLSQPSRRDMGWLRDTLNRESRQFGSCAHFQEDGMLYLSWDDK